MENKVCKYCKEHLSICRDEGLECTVCKKNVHLRCLKRGSVPGGLNGDVFYDFTCENCTSDGNEHFIRIKMSWLQIIFLVLYHLQTRSSGLARKGFFHWRHHIASFIDKSWEILFPTDVKKKKKWMGTIAGTLSHFSGYIFFSGTSIFNEPAWWTLIHPKLTPQGISYVYSKLLLQKQAAKINKEKLPPEAQLYESILCSSISNEEYLEVFNVNSSQISTETTDDSNCTITTKISRSKNTPLNKRKNCLTALGTSRKLLKITGSSISSSDDFTSNFSISDLQKEDSPVVTPVKKEEPVFKESVKFFDPFCHYNTSLNSISRLKGLSLQAKLTGGIKQDLILSPYSRIYLKPYIRRDTETFPTWLKLMAELQYTVNSKEENYVLPSRAPLDYTYVQPAHIPAINSLCNQFFWPGIDVSESLQFPDFSCVVLYKKLIIGFAFLVPDVKLTENYLSFIFTRPYWRNSGIAKFMIYHLIQTSLGKDITLHVSINSPALFLYQKFGFKVENVVLDFYDKYYRTDVKDSKHAFFCRLER